MEKAENRSSEESAPEKDNMSVVLELIEHIERPCEDEKGNTLRADWLRVAKDVLETDEIKNPHAKKMLEDAVKKYSEKQF
jgi:hypothetical protein